jgi:hypothetical protein
MHISLTKILIIFITAVVILSGCELLGDRSDGQRSSNGSFEIYLIPQEVYWEGKGENLACEGEAGPLLSNDDIQSYAVETHAIRLSQTAYERLSKMELAGQPFLVCANQEPIYTGEFMTLWMSRSSEAAVILWPPMDADEQVMKIQLGYPGPDFYTGVDPRADARILRALEQAGWTDKDE